eukprot:CAMPEP_0206570572 /NCGR_PEP_ID=MMETSP0325_2-20121206/27115_1 /ASSEMBLY_ACC=CAM_ASM_000347 /TAXON_ID=2866 /ORGANISM="Crypthecodinium cohnii, Strain Seligo" /LENGTH=84 /DNA_ID=CAMNT_0054074381 /DNA_START=188 /DNA_END=440 /DNA_ORIENTATION=+
MFLEFFVDLLDDPYFPLDGEDLKQKLLPQLQQQRRYDEGPTAKTTPPPTPTPTTPPRRPPYRPSLGLADAHVGLQHGSAPAGFV